MHRLPPAVLRETAIFFAQVATGFFAEWREVYKIFLFLFLLFFYSSLTCWDFVFICYTIKYPGPVQVTVGEPDSNPGQLRPMSGASVALANWATTSPFRLF
jgi:hypothetical protein